MWLHWFKKDAIIYYRGFLRKFNFGLSNLVVSQLTKEFSRINIHADCLTEVYRENCFVFTRFGIRVRLRGNFGSIRWPFHRCLFSKTERVTLSGKIVPMFPEKFSIGFETATFRSLRVPFCEWRRQTRIVEKFFFPCFLAVSSFARRAIRL